MKKYYFVLAAVAAMLSAVACNKEQNTPTEDPAQQEEVVEGEVVTIQAVIPEELSKVALEYTGSALELTWSAGDKIRVADHSNPSTNYQDFTLTYGEGTKSAKFSGTSISAASYDISIISVVAVPSGMGLLSQTQSVDGDTGHLGYGAVLSGVNTYEDITFSSGWATSKGGTLAESGALHLKATLPAGVAAKVNSVTMSADQPIFGGGIGTMVVNLTSQADTGSDNTLDVYATIPASGVTVPSGTTLLFKFGTTDNDHKVYTRYYKTDKVLNLAGGQVNLISLTCTNTDKYAGKDDKGTAEQPYLIADGYQLAAINSYASTSATTYVKLVDNIDMADITHNPINKDIDDYKIVVNFDGNNKTISKLGTCLFYNFKGTIKDLTLDNCSVTSRGIFAEYCQGTGHSITGVTVSGGTVNSASANVGALIGNINSSGTTATITDCTITDTDVTGAGVVGGMIGFADALVTISGCKYLGGTVTTTARFIGGLIGSTGNYASVISNCQVENATVSATIANNDFRAGGFIGQQQTKVTVKGCSVGKSGEDVTLSLSAPTSGKVYNSGGFVGTQYGTVTKNDDDTRNTVYVTITAGNTEGVKQMNLGGFVGYNQGTTSYCDVNVTASSITGSHIGGFAGIIVNGSIQNSTSAGDITGTQKTGGFVGVAQAGSITGCSSSAAVSKVGTTSGTGNGCDFGGFVGEVTQTVTLTKCYAQGSVSINANYVGGFAGSINPASEKTATVSKCWSTGVVTSSSAQCGGFIGHIAANAAGTVNVSDCYETGNLVETNQRQGGLVGQINSGIVTISRCYSSGTVTGSFATGGLIGFMNATATVQNCAAWGSSVTPKSYGDGNWSSGAVIGVAWPVATLTDNYRNPSMSLTAWWVPDADYSHPNVNTSNALIVKDKTSETLRATTATSAASGQDNYPQFAYHGKVDAGKTLSQLASTTLGWSSEVWDFTADLPTLK